MATLAIGVRTHLAGQRLRVLTGGRALVWGSVAMVLVVLVVYPMVWLVLKSLVCVTDDRAEAMATSDRIATMHEEGGCPWLLG